MMNYKKITFIFLIFLINFSFAQKVSKVDILNLNKNFIKVSGHSDLLNQEPKIHKIYTDDTKYLLFYIINYSDAFIVISADKSYSPVKAFSFNHPLRIKSNDSEIHMIDILQSDYKFFKSYLRENPEIGFENQKKWDTLLSGSPVKNVNDAVYGPFLSSLYGQVNCHDNNGHLVNVTNYYTPNHYAVGCVAMVFSEVMRYYNWPRKGVGNFSYTDSYGSSQGTYSADFSEEFYNWGSILDEYDGEASTEQQRSELGKLAFHAAVSVRMDFENGGSTSNINKIPYSAWKFFRYVSEYKEKTAFDFWQTLDTSLRHNIPAQFAIYTSGGAGHAVVGDGIKYIGNEKYYHLNMGWWGDDNSWYQIHQSFNAGGYSNITAAVLNMIPIPEMNDSPDLDEESRTVNLEWYYTYKIPVQNYELQFKKGPDDWVTVADTITTKTYIFQTDSKNDYSFRIRAQVNGEWKNNGWSNEIKIAQADFKEKEVFEGDEELTLYPTAASEELRVSYKKLSGSTVRIYNLRGSLVFQSDEDILINEYKINVSSFQTGFYILQISNDSERIATSFLKL